MDKRFLTPKETASTIVNVNIKRADLTTKSCIMLGVLAGIFIGLGGLGNIIFGQTISGIDPGLGRFVGAMVFPVGLMLVVICGAELFTGNNLMSLAVMQKKISINKMFRNWILVYIANFIGSLILAVVVFYSGTLSANAADNAISIATSKVNLDFMQMFLRGIMCNIIVVLSVWMATASQDIISKIFSCWFPIMLFVLCGFEHSVANMFFIPMGMLLGADISILGLFSNLIIVTLGNIVGGAVIIPYIYNDCFLKNNISKNHN